jgi:DNA-binding FadR family transcriptional regulator
MPLSRVGSLSVELAKVLGDRIREGRWLPGMRLPSESCLITEFDVSRSVVREAISRLRAANIVVTRHGVGTFAASQAYEHAFRITLDQVTTLHDVIAMLELRTAVECESAALAAQRRSDRHMTVLQDALDAFSSLVESGENAVEADFSFHLEIARATQNPLYVELLEFLGKKMIPRSRLDRDGRRTEQQKDYLRFVNLEHLSILDAIRRQNGEDARSAMRTHLFNSRERRRNSEIVLEIE